jgi:hypothetical protein
MVCAQAFRHFQYLTSPEHVSDDFMNTALATALTPAFDEAPTGKDR